MIITSKIYSFFTIGLVLGIYNVAVHYFAGKGVEHSFEKAIEYFQKAADRGFTAAQVMITPVLITFFNNTTIGVNFCL